MKNRGFTLIELLAIITILSLILLIAFTSVTTIMKNSKNNLHNSQINQIIRSAQFYNNKEGLKDYDTCVEVSELVDKGYIKEDKVIDPNGGEEITGSVKISYKNNKYTYEYKDKNCTICKATNGVVSTDLGTKYSCEVKDNTNFNFYVLSTNEDDTVNLIMDRNICENGTVNYTEMNNYCIYPWYENEVNSEGPITAMAKLYDGTKDWTNVPNINLKYSDIIDQKSKGYTKEATYGYGGVNIINGVGKITSKSGEEQTIPLTDNMPIKARLPKYSEVYGNDENHCNEVDSSCPSWLTENSTYLNNIITEDGVQYKLGDVNSDRKITEEDVDLVNQKSKGLDVSFSDLEMKIADINKDGQINTSDVLIINAHYNGLLTDYMTQNITDDQHNYGYWTMSSMPSKQFAFAIGFDKNILFSSVTNDYFGVRPVITVPKNYLSK